MTRLPITDLTADPDNPRAIELEALTGLGASLEEFGDISGITFNETTGELVCGHQRLSALKAAGATEFHLAEGRTWVEHPETGERFAVRRVQWSREKQRAANLAANNPSIGGEFTKAALDQIRALEDQELLSALRLDDLEDVLAAEFEKAGTDEARAVETDEAEAAADEPPPVAPGDPITQSGDLWVLGDHRLLCGDSFRPEDRARLLDGKLMDAVVMDPPYAIYGSSTGIGADIADDKMVRPFFEQLFRFTVQTVAEFGHIYVCCDWRSWAAIWDGAKRAGASAKNCLVWDKGSAGLGSSYANTYELIGFFARLPPATAMTSSTKTGQRMVHKPNIMRHNRVTGAEREHNAAKPVAMFRDLIENSSDPGDHVVDWFGGSGTTIAACELSSRHGYAMEMEPKFCDIIVARWERMSGRKAERRPAP